MCLKSVLAGAEPSSGAGSDSRSTLSSRGASLTNLEMTFRVSIVPLKHYEVTSDAVDELDEPVAVDRAAASRDEAAVHALLAPQRSQHAATSAAGALDTSSPLQS